MKYRNVQTMVTVPQVPSVKQVLAPHLLLAPRTRIATKPPVKLATVALVRPRLVRSMKIVPKTISAWVVFVLWPVPLTKIAALASPAKMVVVGRVVPKMMSASVHKNVLKVLAKKVLALPPVQKVSAVWQASVLKTTAMAMFVRTHRSVRPINVLRILVKGKSAPQASSVVQETVSRAVTV